MSSLALDGLPVRTICLYVGFAFKLMPASSSFLFGLCSPFLFALLLLLSLSFLSLWLVHCFKATCSHIVGGLVLVALRLWYLAGLNVT